MKQVFIVFTFFAIFATLCSAILKMPLRKPFHETDQNYLQKIPLHETDKNYWQLETKTDYGGGYEYGNFDGRTHYGGGYKYGIFDGRNHYGGIGYENGKLDINFDGKLSHEMTK